MPYSAAEDERMQMVADGYDTLGGKGPHSIVYWRAYQERNPKFLPHRTPDSLRCRWNLKHPQPKGKKRQRDPEKKEKEEIEEEIADLEELKADAARIEAIETLLEQRQEEYLMEPFSMELAMDVLRLTEMLEDAVQSYNTKMDRHRTKLLALTEKKPKLMAKALINHNRQ